MIFLPWKDVQPGDLLVEDDCGTIVISIRWWRDKAIHFERVCTNDCNVHLESASPNETVNVVRYDGN